MRLVARPPRTVALLAASLALLLAAPSLAQQTQPKRGKRKRDAPAAAAEKAEAKPPAHSSSRLLAPSELTATAPDTFTVRFHTTAGEFVVEAHRDWAPNGADRFYNLVKEGYYDDTAFFRVISGFMAQFGLNGDPKVNAAWEDASIPDDAVTQSNTRGMVSFATRGPNTRTTQLFINYGDNGRLDGRGFSPFAQVVEGMEVVDALYSGYGDGAPYGRGPSQGLIQSKGNEYLKAEFPELTFIEKAVLVE